MRPEHMDWSKQVIENGTANVWIEVHMVADGHFTYWLNFAGLSKGEQALHPTYALQHNEVSVWSSESDAMALMAQFPQIHFFAVTKSVKIAFRDELITMTEDKCEIRDEAGHILAWTERLSSGTASMSEVGVYHHYADGAHQRDELADYAKGDINPRYLGVFTDWLGMVVA